MLRVEIYPRLRNGLDNIIALLGQHNFLQSVIVKRDDVYAQPQGAVSINIKEKQTLDLLSEIHGQHGAGRVIDKFFERMSIPLHCLMHYNCPRHSGMEITMVGIGSRCCKLMIKSSTSRNSAAVQFAAGVASNGMVHGILISPGYSSIYAHRN